MALTILIIGAVCIFMRWFYIEGNKLYEEGDPQITRKVDIILYKLQLGFVSYFKSFCILVLLLIPAIITIIWRQMNRYDNETFTILIVISVSVFCLGLLAIYFFDKLTKEK